MNIKICVKVKKRKKRRVLRLSILVQMANVFLKSGCVMGIRIAMMAVMRNHVMILWCLENVTRDKTGLNARTSLTALVLTRFAMVLRTALTKATRALSVTQQKDVKTFPAPMGVSERRRGLNVTVKKGSRYLGGSVARRG